MFKPRFSLLTLLLACACAVIVTFAGIMALIQHAAGNSVSGMVFLKTLVTVRDNYVEPVDSEKLFDGATTGMVKALGDPYSAYLDKKSFSEITDLTDGVFGGIGVVLGKKDNDFVVVAPMEGTPGDEAGIKAGDKILAVDGTSVDGMQLEDVSLCPTQFPETVTASIASTQAGELAEILLVANYADGTQAEITRGVTCAVENTGIAQPAGRWLVCRSEGQTEVTVTVTIAGRDYTAKTMLTVLPGASEQAPEKQPDGADRNGDDFDDLVWVIWAAVAGVAILCGAAAFLVAWKRKKTRG